MEYEAYAPELRLMLFRSWVLSTSEIGFAYRFDKKCWGWLLCMYSGVCVERDEYKMLLPQNIFIQWKMERRSFVSQT